MALKYWHGAHTKHRLMYHLVWLPIQAQPTETVAHVIQVLKGGSSRVIRQEFPELEEFLWGDSLWADGYFAKTVGATSFAAVKSYIRENKDSMPQPK